MASFANVELGGRQGNTPTRKAEAQCRRRRLLWGKAASFCVLRVADQTFRSFVRRLPSVVRGRSSVVAFQPLVAGLPCSRGADGPPRTAASNTSTRITPAKTPAV